MTTDAARLLGVETRRVAIKMDLRADIIATSENPLDNIQTLKKVAFIMKNGKVFKNQSVKPIYAQDIFASQYKLPSFQALFSLKQPLVLLLQP